MNYSKLKLLCCCFWLCLCFAGPAMAQNRQGFHLRFSDDCMISSQDQGKTWFVSQGELSEVPSWARAWLESPPKRIPQVQTLNLPGDFILSSEDAGQHWHLVEGNYQDLPAWAQAWVKNEERHVLQASEVTLDGSLCQAENPVQNTQNISFGPGVRIISHDQGQTWSMAEGQPDEVPEWAQSWLDRPHTPKKEVKTLRFLDDTEIKSEDGGKTWVMSNGLYQDLPNWVKPWIKGDYVQEHRLEAAEAMAKLADEAHLSYFPNPAGNAVTLRFSLDRIQTLQIELTDLQGRSLRHWDRKADHPGQQEFQLNLNQIPSGVFFLRVSGEFYHEQIQLVHLE
jgi:hypothetical protein